MADANNHWSNLVGTAACPRLENGTWATVRATLGPTARVDNRPLDGAGGIRILVGDSDPSHIYVTAYVDSFEFNGDISDFEAPTMSLSGAKASIPAGGSIELPAAAVLSGPNQPSFGNNLGPITGNGGLTSSAPVAVTSSPAGLCTLTPATVSFAPAPGLGVETARDSTALSLKVKTKAGAGGSCRLGIGSSTTATAAGGVTLTVTPTATLPPKPPGPVTTCSAKAVAGKSKIKVNMGPDRPGNGYYRFRVDVRKSDGWFRYLKMIKTKGAKETRTVNVPKGTYRIKCYGPTEAQNSRSKVVKIKK